MPAATFLIMPARTISWWQITSASFGHLAGGEQVVWLQRIIASWPVSWHALEQARRILHALHHLLLAARRRGRLEACAPGRRRCAPAPPRPTRGAPCRGGSGWSATGRARSTAARKSTALSNSLPLVVDPAERGERELLELVGRQLERRGARSRAPGRGPPPSPPGCRPSRSRRSSGRSSSRPRRAAAADAVALAELALAAQRLDQRRVGGGLQHLARIELEHLARHRLDLLAAVERAGRARRRTSAASGSPARAASARR